jgi:response regulator of citrate/malate metabolism
VLFLSHLSVRNASFAIYFEAFHTKLEEQRNNRNGVLSSSTALRTQTQLDTVNTYFANTHNEKQEPTDINVLQLRALTNIFKIFKIQKDKINIVLNIVTTMKISKAGYILHFMPQPM